VDQKRASLPLQTEGALARTPIGYGQLPAALGETLKLKSWLVKQDLSAAEIMSSELVETLAVFAAKAAPLLEFE
jgi:uncharacterized protein (DUF2461 family)